MAGKILPNIGIFGGAGSGKSSFGRELIVQLKPRFEYLVIVNNSEELSDLAVKREIITGEMAEADWNPERLAEFIRFYKAVHFEVLVARPVNFMDALARAIKLLGVYDAQDGRVLFVVDECHKFMSKAVFAKSQAVQAIDLELRKYGIGVIKITPRIQSTSMDAIAFEAVTQCRQWFVFPFNGGPDIDAARKVGFPDPSSLRYPDPNKNLPPDYYAKDCTTGAILLITRDDNGNRHAEQIGGLPMDFAPYLEQLNSSAPVRSAA